MHFAKCNYWSFVNDNAQGVDAAYNAYCYLYSSIDTTCTSCTSITGCTSCSSCASCTYCDGGYCTDTGRISGDVSCPGAQALIACCRTIKLPCCPPCERYDTCDTVCLYIATQSLTKSNLLCERFECRIAIKY